MERTFDESAYQSFLLFNDKKNYFLWVLNEEEGLHDILQPVGADLLVGKRSGFAFWIDRAHGNRKVLAAVRRLSVSRNDYYDGPFDQLADNYAEEVGISEYMQRALPGLRGRIDKFGYRTDKDRPLRVALSNYHTLYDPQRPQEFPGKGQGFRRCLLVHLSQGKGETDDPCSNT